MVSRDKHLFGDGPKRILSLDGGGVRGLITLGILSRVEDLLRARVPAGQQDRFRLCDYFDLIGGTSTGALIATQLAMGETVAEITERYRKMCPRIFTQTRWFRYIESKLDTAAFNLVLKETFFELLKKHGHSPTVEPDLDSPLLKTGLAVVTKRIDTGSVWVLTNNPRHKFWDRKSPHWGEFWEQSDPTVQFYANGSYPLRRVVQASASAPFFLDPVRIDVDPKQPGLFLDGGASPFNDPSSELLFMAALKANGRGDAVPSPSPHGFSWPTGQDKMFMLSVGTGTWRLRHTLEDFRGKTASVQAIEALRGIISDSQKNTQAWMQALSVPPRNGPEVSSQHHIDFNLGSLGGLTILPEPLLTYRRVNAVIESKWLESNLGNEFKYDAGMINRLRELDQPAKAHHERCHAIGVASGQKFLNEDDFPSHFDVYSAA